MAEEPSGITTEAREAVARAEVDQHLASLNANWKRYDDIMKNRVSFDSPRERGQAARLARESYMHEELWLAQQGYPWHLLPYDKPSRTFSLPE